MAKNQPEPGVAELFEAIVSYLPRATGFRGGAIRSAAVSYATAQDFLSGEGAAAVGGRWNPRGVRAVYASLSPTTAACESYQNFKSYGFVAAIRPRVFCGVAVVLQRVFDLTAPGVRRQIGFTLQDLLGEDWHGIQEEGDEAWTQAIGRGAFVAGFEAVLAPSARDRPNGRNLVIFPERILPGSKIELVGREELPAHPEL